MCAWVWPEWEKIFTHCRGPVTQRCTHTRECLWVQCMRCMQTQTQECLPPLHAQHAGLWLHLQTYRIFSVCSAVHMHVGVLDADRNMSQGALREHILCWQSSCSHWSVNSHFNPGLTGPHLQNAQRPVTEPAGARWLAGGK